MINALATPRVAASIDDRLERVRALLFQASERGAEIVCLPEGYLPGQLLGLQTNPQSSTRRRVERLTARRPSRRGPNSKV